MRIHVPDAYIPFWDSTLDRHLPNPRHSVLFHPELLGDHDGYVTTGNFANWRVHQACQRGKESFLQRNVTSGLSNDRARESLIHDWDILDTLSMHRFEELYMDPYIENYHGGPHVFIGGHMGDLACSPSDPVFFLHHAFIDCIWESFRREEQTSNLTDYGPGTGGPAHAPTAKMEPFHDLLNRDGLSTHYTR